MSAPEVSLLELVWPDLRRRLMRQLTRRGMDPATAEDIVQEVAARILARHMVFSSVDGLMRWAATVARHLAVDNWRAQVRRPTVPLEDAPCLVGLDEVLEHRQRLAAVMRSWPHLSDFDRHALTGPARGAEAATRKEAVRWAVRRHAARARLTALVDRPERLSA